VREDTELVARSNRALPPSTAAPGLVLVVEDEPDVAMLCQLHLQRAGIESVAVDCGRDALEAAARLQPPVVLLDRMLPDMDGLTVLQALCGTPPSDELPVVVMLTARTEPRDQRDAWAAGAAAYLTKPFVGEQLVAAVRDALVPRAPSERARRRHDALARLSGADPGAGRATNGEPVRPTSAGDRTEAERTGTRFDESAQLAAIVEHSGDAILAKTLTGIITAWNRSAEELYGWTAAEVIGQPVSLLVPADQADEVPAILRHIAAGEVVPPYETVRQTKDGRRIEVSLMVSPIKDATGRIVGASAVARDVSGRRRELVRLRALVDAAPDAMIIVDPTGRIALANARTQALFGYASAELVGQPVELLVPPSRRARHLQHRAAYAAAPEDRHLGPAMGLRGLRRDGTEVAVEISLSSISWEDGVMTLTVIRDATAQQQADEARQAEREADEQLSRDRNDVLSTVSHELRTPLTAIKGFAELLLADLDDTGDEHQLDLVRRIAAAGARLDQMVEDLLEATRLGQTDVAVAVTPVDIEPLIDEAIRHSAPLLAHHHVEVEVERDLIGLADAAALVRVMTNLLTNAAKFSPRGTTIRVEGARDGTNLVVVVRDDGIGIPAAELKSIFERFHRADHGRPTPAGTGLGLAIVKELTEAQGGSVAVQSSPGHGSAFTVRLPSVAGPSATPGVPLTVNGRSPSGAVSDGSRPGADLPMHDGEVGGPLGTGA
jgi:PAS domain S-box-containing protein